MTDQEPKRLDFGQNMLLGLKRRCLKNHGISSKFWYANNNFVRQYFFTFEFKYKHLEEHYTSNFKTEKFPGGTSVIFIRVRVDLVLKPNPV